MAQQQKEYKINPRPMDDHSDDEKQPDDELSKWLKNFGLSKYESALREEQVEYDMLQVLEDEDVDELVKDSWGMRSIHKKILKKAIMHVRTGQYPPKPVEIAPAEAKLPDKWEMLRAKRKKQGLRDYVHLKPDNIDDVIGGKTRTMIFIGQTGAGKTTLINSMCNYLNCVAYKEPFRYKLIMESKDKTIIKDQTRSQTREISKYYLNKLPGVEYAYGLNIVDTPGFGDTEGPEQDLKIRSKFKEFFNQIDSVDGIYFVVKASDTRLGATQKYIFNMVLDLFGENVKGNILLLFTFSDGAEPPALKAVKKMDVPFTKEFRINNSGFGLSGKRSNRTHEMFFNLGMEQFKEIFETLDRVEPKSIINSLQTLKEREAITNWLTSIRDAVQMALEGIETTKRLKHECEQNALEINNNQDYEFDDIVYQERRQKTEYYNIGCADCNVICYERASSELIEKDELPKSSVFEAESGNCTVCKDRCSHLRHSVVQYILVKEKKVVKRRRSEMFQKYSKARQNVQSAEELIARMKQDIKHQDYKVRKAIKMMKESVNRLQKIALRKKVLSDDEYYDTLIAMEQSERKEGWQKRCESLTKMKEDKATFLKIMQDPDKEFGLLAGLDLDDDDDDDDNDDKEYEDGIGIQTPRTSAKPSPKNDNDMEPVLNRMETNTQYNVNLFGYTIFSFSAAN